jgi:uncharacterized repeat protein (TIGR03847 family)
MPNTEIEMNPVDFVTVGTIGPKGQRLFHLQAGKEQQLVSMIIEKEQAWALSEAVREMVDDLDERFPNPDGAPTVIDMAAFDMDLREPIEPVFRVAQMGLGYDEERNMVVLVAQELVIVDEDAPVEDIEPGVVRLWCSRPQMRALSLHAMETVQAGRADPRQNGRVVYYWT